MADAGDVSQGRRSAPGGEAKVSVRITGDALVPIKSISSSELRIEQHPMAAGPFGATYKAQYGGSLAVVKVPYPRGNESQRQQLENATMEEAAVMQRASGNRHVIEFYGVWRDENGMPCLVVAFAENGGLDSYMDRHPDAFQSNEERLRIAHEAALGILHLHCEDIVHRRNIAMRNFLLDEALRVKVTDFGLSRVKHRDAKFSSTLARSPVVESIPEVLQARLEGKAAPFGKASDVYMFGLIMWQLWSRQRPYADLPRSDLALLKYVEYVQAIIAGTRRPERPAGMPDACWRLVQDCWQSDAKSRPSMQDVVDRLRAMRG